MRNLLSTAALLTILAAPAVAQTTTTTPDRPATPPAATAPTTTTPGTSMTSSGEVQYYAPAAGEHRASKLIGTLVKNSAGETVGDVNEIILSKDGKAMAAVLGVGGFLGMGERHVAVSFSSLNFTQDANGNMTVMLPTATKESLKTAPEWKTVAR